MMLFVGRIVRNKGLHLTISAFSRVAQHYPTAKLFVMGPAEDNSFAKAEGQIKDLNLGDRFFYLGLQTGDNYWSAMAGADLFVLNSYSENFGNVVTDALSVGVPVLISDQVGIASLVSQYEAGEVATLEIHDIVEKMMRMLGEPERLREMGRRGIQLVRENCAHAVVGRQLADYFYEIYESIRFKV
jgi:glycosyltransferase involved in cell wall biosynthesis